MVCVTVDRGEKLFKSKCIIETKYVSF